MKHKTLYVGFGFSLLALLVLRVCQLAFAIESTTGFYKPEYENFSFVSAAAIIISVAAITYFSFTDIVGSSKIEGKPLAIFCILSAVGFVLKAYFLAFNSSPSLMGIYLVTALLSLVCGAVYLLYAYSLLKGQKIKPHFLAIVPVFWIFELIGIFVRSSDVSALSERFFETVTAALCVIFSLYLVKEKAGMLTNISTKIMVAISLTASVFCIILSLSPLLIILFGKGNLLHSFSYANIVYLAYGIYIPAYVFTTFKHKKVQ